MKKTENKESGNARTEVPPGGILSREGLLVMLSEIVKKQHAKAMRGRIHNPKTFQAHLDAGRVFAYIAGVYNGLLKEKELSEILERLDALEEQQNAKQ